MNRNLLAPCGTNCGHCPYHIKERTLYCDGCEAQNGHPFWGECKLFICVKDHDVEHCGLCNDFPCDLFVKQYDPEQGQKSAFMRAGLLAYRKRYGTEKYVEISKKLDDHK